MSEYQYVAFRALDGPVSDENLKFMRQQSSRAEITPWSFDNEYHFGDFHGKAAEMLRRGYDLHLHYANFGTRTLMIRLPHRLPDSAVQRYFLKDSLFFERDKQGQGGNLVIEPCYEAGQLEELWDVDLNSLVERLLPLRAEILDGDLRPLYIAYLAVTTDLNHDPDEEQEAPVPAGLDRLTPAQIALAKFYGIDDGILAAAAANSPPLGERVDVAQTYAAWLRGRPVETRTTWLAELLANPRAPIRAEILAEFKKSAKTSAWPVSETQRTVAELQAAGAEIDEHLKRQRNEEASRQCAENLARMAAEPESVLRETESMVQQRSTAAYDQIATLLADLRTALAGSPRAGLADQHARKLTARNPTLTRLTSALRKKGLLKE